MLDSFWNLLIRSTYLKKNILSFRCSLVFAMLNVKMVLCVGEGKSRYHFLLKREYRKSNWSTVKNEKSNIINFYFPVTSSILSLTFTLPFSFFLWYTFDYLKANYASPPLSVRDIFQDPTVDSTKRYIYWFFLYITMMKFNL